MERVGNEEFAIEHRVKLVPQDSRYQCWRAVAKMLLGGREPSTEGVVLGSVGGLLSNYANMQTFARVNGLLFHGTITWSEDGLRRLLV